MTTDTSATSSYVHAMDAQGWRPIHTTILIALGLGWMLDAFEVTLIGNVLPILRQIWSLSSLESTLAISLWLGGVLIGALVFGVAADRFGRRRLFVLTLLIYSIGTFAAAFSVNFWMFLTLRVIAAIGVGAEYSAVNAAITELTPAGHRGRAAALVMSFWPLGALLGGALTLGILALAPPEIAWRFVFGGGATIALFVLWARRVLPESPRWLLTQGREEEAKAEYRRIAGHEAAAQWLKEARMYLGVRHWFSDLGVVCRNYPARLALGATLDFSEAGGYYGLFALIPLAIIPALHLSFAGTPLFYLVGGAGALVGALIAAWMIESRGRKVTVTGFYAASAVIVGLMATALQSGTALTMIMFIMASASTTGSWVAAYPLFAEIFPTRSRASGIGASVAIGRIAAGLSPPLLVFIAGRYSATTALIVAAGFYVIGVVAMIPWISYGPESKGISLESLAGPD